MNEQQHRKQNLRKQSTKNRIWCTLNPRPCTLNPKPWSLQLLHPEMASLDWLTSSMVVCYLILFQKPMESMHSFHEQQGSGEREFLGRKKEGVRGRRDWWSPKLVVTRHTDPMLPACWGLTSTTLTRPSKLLLHPISCFSFISSISSFLAPIWACNSWQLLAPSPANAGTLLPNLHPHLQQPTGLCNIKPYYYYHYY